MTIGVVTLVIAVCAAVLLASLHRRTQGRTRVVDATQILAPADLGAALGPRATLVQFSSAFCAPCRATRRILGEVGGQVEGVAVVDIDAESHLELVRRLGIVRTPTTLVLNSAGHVVTRASGQPRPADVLAALGRAID